ncbi:MAG: EpsI family protein [Deltaproteobacteria bacterium]|nr:EpsI family protein [Deltaproteobacteria bacterium]
MTKTVVAILFVGLNFYIYHYLATEEVIPERVRFDEFPLEIGEWRCQGVEHMTEEVIANLGATDDIICSYYNPTLRQWVNVSANYHETQVRKQGGGAGENSIHPPEHCLPGSGWDIIDNRVVPFRSGELEGEAKRFVIAKGEARQLVYFWYQSRGRIIARLHDVIIYKFWDRATRRRTDGSLFRLTTPIVRSDEQAAEDAIVDFAQQFTPLLPDYIPQ